MTNVLLAKMTWQDVRERLEAGYDIAIVPTGSIEQHGPMLPLDTDIYNCYEITKRAAEKVAEEVKPIVTPPIWSGFSYTHMDFPGTITLKEETFARVVTEVCESLIHHGFKKVVIINGHGANTAALHNARYRTKIKTDAFIAVADWWTFGWEMIRKTFERPIFHADDWETSVSLALGNDVEMERAVDEVPMMPLPKYIKLDLTASPPKVHFPLRMKEWSKSGVWGYPTKASKEKGEKCVEAAVNGLAEFLRDLKDLKWEEKS